MVIEKDVKVKRHFWKLAVVEQLIEGKDGHVRAAVIKVGESNSRKKRVSLKRSIKHLYPKGINANDTESESQEMMENPARLLLETVTIRNPFSPEP